MANKTLEILARERFSRAEWAEGEEYEKLAIKALNTYLEYILDRKLTLQELTLSTNLVSLLLSWVAMTEDKEAKNGK
jgi:hypothetical protein